MISISVSFELRSPCRLVAVQLLAVRLADLPVKDHPHVLRVVDVVALGHRQPLDGDATRPNEIAPDQTGRGMRDLRVQPRNRQRTTVFL